MVTEETYRTIAVIVLLIALVMLFAFMIGVLWMVLTDADLGKPVAIFGTLTLLFTLIFGFCGMLGI